MNKLVSRNPILRFLLGKKIVKAQLGVKFVKAGSDTWGNTIWADTYTGDLYKSNLDPNKNIKNFSTKTSNYLGKNYNFYNIFSGRGTINGSDYIRKNQVKNKDYSFMKGTPRTRTPEELKKWEVEVLRLKNLMLNDARKAVSTTNNVLKNTFKPKTVSPRFIKGYNDEGLLAEIGGTLNIKAWQLKLKDFYAPGTYTDDGLWGKNTLAAYEKYLLALNIQPLAPTIPETPITPTLKYTPTNYYALNTLPSLFGQSTLLFLLLFARKYNLKPSLNFQYLKNGGLISKSPVERFRNKINHKL